MHLQRPLRRLRLARHLRRWGSYWIVGLGLLAASQMLWRWQTWKLRTLLHLFDGAWP